MAYKICPICEVEITQAHDCMQNDFSNFSIELELLGLPFVLEPYDLAGEYLITPDPFIPERSLADSIVRGRPVPSFLRM